jgi:Spy/CpxP family protein refolding chaperone
MSKAEWKGCKALPSAPRQESVTDNGKEKNMNRNKIGISVIFAAILCMGATFAVAGIGGGGPCEGHGMHGPGHLLKFLYRLDLSDAQKTQVAGILKQLEPEAKEAVRGMADAKIQLANVTLSGTYDEAAVRQASVQVSSRAEDLALIRAKAISGIMGILTPEQKDLLEKTKNRITERLDGMVDARFEHLDAWIAKHAQ